MHIKTYAGYDNDHFYMSPFPKLKDTLPFIVDRLLCTGLMNDYLPVVKLED